MFALVCLSDNSLPDVPHEPVRPEACPDGHAWWEIETERPPFNRKTDVCTPGNLYADTEAKRVRRRWIVREKTPYERAEERGLHHLKMLVVSDAQMVRALEDTCLFLLAAAGKSLDDLPEIVAKKFRDRQGWRAQIK